MVGSGERPRKFPNWSWAGATVFVLALCLGLSWGTALVMSASARTPPISDTTSDLLLAVGGVLAGAISVYVGGIIALKRKRDDDDDEDQP
jgi:hypothetical protein